MKISNFINAFFLKLLSDIAYFSVAVLVIRLMEYTYDTIDLYKFAVYLAGVAMVYNFYDELIDNILHRLFHYSYDSTFDDKGDTEE